MAHEAENGEETKPLQSVNLCIGFVVVVVVYFVCFLFFAESHLSLFLTRLLGKLRIFLLCH